MNVETLVVGDLFTNCYILDPETKEALVVDPGGDAQTIVQALRGKGFHLRYIVATHAHFDHVCGMKELQDTLGGETLLHRADLLLLESLPAQGAAFGMRTGPIPRIDRFLEEGDLLPLGKGHFRVLHTPGHSPGGISLIGHGMAFVGDALFAGSIGRTDLPGSSYETLLDSIHRKLLTLEENTLIFPGHGEASTIGEEIRTNPFLTPGDAL
jgi:glyoxylase-like metal-dependent hydrolase (beta-lactamase superfamily II)